MGIVNNKIDAIVLLLTIPANYSTLFRDVGKNKSTKSPHCFNQKISLSEGPAMVDTVRILWILLLPTPYGACLEKKYHLFFLKK